MRRWNRILDFFVLAGSLNFHKLINLFKVGLSYFSFILFRTVKHNGLPVAASIEPTTSCNLRCPECPTGKGTLLRAKGNMDVQFFQSITDQISSHILYLTLYFQGEPFLNPGIFEMITYARSRKIYVATSTNGHYLDKTAEATVRSGLNRLIVSLDGIDQEAYSSYRKGGDFNKVTDGVRQVVKWKKKLHVRHPYLVIQFLVLSSNEHQKEAIMKYGYELGADEVQLKKAQFSNYKSGNALMPSDKKYSRYRNNTAGGFISSFKVANRCFRMWSSTVITWDGIVAPCCFDKNADHRMGNLAEEDFNSIWESSRFKSFSSSIRHYRSSFEMCCNCTQRW
ncbi:MAG: radical SAM/SPASM domain-containing protein [Bacteroidales bacterium]